VGREAVLEGGLGRGADDRAEQLSAVLAERDGLADAVAASLTDDTT